MIDRETQLKHRANRYKSMYERQKSIRDLFERKFINYRNQMLRMRESLPKGDPMRDEITKFLQEQGDVEFYD